MFFFKVLIVISLLPKRESFTISRAPEIGYFTNISSYLDVFFGDESEVVGESNWAFSNLNSMLLLPGRALSIFFNPSGAVDLKTEEESGTMAQTTEAVNVFDKRDVENSETNNTVVSSMPRKIYENVYEWGFRAINVTASSLTKAMETAYILPVLVDDSFLEETLSGAYTSLNSAVDYLNSTFDLATLIKTGQSETGKMVDGYLQSSFDLSGFGVESTRGYLTDFFIESFSHFFNSERCLERSICTLELDQMFHGNGFGRFAVHVAKSIPGESSHIYEAVDDIMRARQGRRFSCAVFECEMADHTHFDYSIAFLANFFHYMQTNGCLDKLVCILGVGRLIPNSYGTWAFALYASRHATDVTAPLFKTLLNTLSRPDLDTCDDISCTVNSREMFLAMK